MLPDTDSDDEQLNIFGSSNGIYTSCFDHVTYTIIKNLLDQSDVGNKDVEAQFFDSYKQLRKGLYLRMTKCNVLFN